MVLAGEDVISKEHIMRPTEAGAESASDREASPSEVSTVVHPNVNRKETSSQLKLCALGAENKPRANFYLKCFQSIMMDISKRGNLCQ